MAKRGENIRKRKDGRWEGRYPKGKKDGRTVMGSVFGKTYQEAKEKLIFAKASLSETLPNTQTAAVVMDTFSKTAEEWLVATKPGLKKSSICKYRNVLDKHLLPEFGDNQVSAITRDDVSVFSAKLLSSKEDGGKGLAPKTVSSIISVMKNVMDYAKHVKGANIIDFDGLSIKQPLKQLRVFSTYEQDTLVTKLLENLDFISLGILLCLFTGLRIGEVCALMWSDISFDEQKLRVTRTMQRIQESDGKGHKTKIEIDCPKSDCSIRDIPLPDEVFSILVEMRQPDGCFFLTGLEGTFVEPRQMEKCFSRIVKSCGIEKATVHTCRHSFATRCVEVGFDIKTLSEILGHASVAITMNRYVHPSMELKAQNMNKLCGLLSGVKNRVNKNEESA
ncbi:tyrosine-type recombinase/integrase [Luxibacter massiliensis]|uniref:tyrosine-type recombinase/integrase n=1 Tax=Luxibacter massiliensis TaxID=2219695 RepID=UPI0013E01465|nr:site-specific integrase [Luxibacter massiliensis]